MNLRYKPTFLFFVMTVNRFQSGYVADTHCTLIDFHFTA